MRNFGLSKSKIAAFEQCPKRLWLSVHRPSEAVIDDATQAAFNVGHEVGELACQFYPDGMMVDAIPDMNAAIERTQQLLELDPPRPIFEATFRHEGVLVRVDLMIPAGDGRWHVAEVKSSTSAKPYQINDLATQIWVLEGCGLLIASASIRHIDRDFVYAGDQNYLGFFKDATSDELIAPIMATRSATARDAQATLQGEEPALEPGDHCTDPFSCPFQAYCNRGRKAPEWPIDLLPNSGRKLASKWAEQGIIELAELPADALSNPIHRRIHQATVSGESYHDRDGARGATAHWQTPHSYLDFETIAFAVPRWKGTRPFQQVPFQYSLHIDQGGDLTHLQFLDLSGDDPRRACAEALIAQVPRQGAVIAYNASFERECIRSLAGQFPDLAPHLLGIADRLVDLLPVARANWYDRKQRGSWSIKAVLPTIAEQFSYAELEVGDGGSAQLAYLEAIAADCAEERRTILDAALRAYCHLDTLAMVAVHRRLVGRSLPS